ncbi:serine hydrolase [Microbacterium sp. YY-03]|uniref:serine hydrolase n=1 Tax=Microbacterium sp. YY-03 TaxID=3421636 RepID=UPI003D17A12B
MTRTSFIRNLLSVVAVTATAVLALSACTASTPEPKPTTSKTTDAAPPATIPSTPVGERMQTIVDLLNQEADLAEADLEGLFDSTFTDAVPLPDVVQLLNVQIRPAQPIVITAYEGSETQAVAQASGSVGEPFAIQLSLTSEGLIDGFALTPATMPDPAQSLGEVQERLDALDLQYTVTRTDPDGTSAVLLEKDADKAAPMASMFKLYVLLAVHQQVAAQKLSWDNTLGVTDELRSLPSGELQNEPTGTEVTVRDAAIKMISISDNTATDMLIDRVSRGAVEAAVVKAGHHDPDALRPFLMTREMFMLAFGSDDAVQQQWAAASVDERRAILENLTIDLDSIDLANISTDPFWQEGLDWFATPNDVAAVHAALAKIDDPAVVEALTTNPGVMVDAATWPQVAFKGGSSMGVVSGSWHAVADDGTTLTVVVMASGDDAEAVAMGQIELFSLVTDIFTLVGTE